MRQYFTMVAILLVSVSAVSGDDAPKPLVKAEEPKPLVKSSDRVQKLEDDVKSLRLQVQIMTDLVGKKQRADADSTANLAIGREILAILSKAEALADQIVVNEKATWVDQKKGIECVMLIERVRGMSSGVYPYMDMRNELSPVTMSYDEGEMDLTSVAWLNYRISKAKKETLQIIARLEHPRPLPPTLPGPRKTAE
jgi:hypothetical protein